MNNKTRIVIIVTLIVMMIGGFVYYWEYYLFPSKYDFQRNGDRYMEIINLMNEDEYRDVVSLGGGVDHLGLKDSGPDDYKKKITYPQKYIDLMQKAFEIDNTYFNRCGEDIIKIEKGGSFNNYFELTYVYSKKGFKELPGLTLEKINDHVIVHHNYEGNDYSADYYCKLQ